MEPTDAVMDPHGSPYLLLGDYLAEQQHGTEKTRAKLLQPVATTLELDTSSDLDTESEASGSDSEDGDELLSPTTLSQHLLDDASQTITDFGAFSGPPPPPTLVSLPPEIRHEILKHLLILPSEKPVPHSEEEEKAEQQDDAKKEEQDQEDASHTYRQRPGLLHPAILRACRQLYAEARPLLYRGNAFAAHGTLLTALPRLRPAFRPVADAAAAAEVSRFRVRVRLDAEPAYDAAAAASHLSGKEEVVLEAVANAFRVDGDEEETSGIEVLRLFEGVRGVRRASVVLVDGALAGFEGYARWLENAMTADADAHVEPFPWDEVEAQAQSS
ncbi:hypothetical protein GGR52DRAFT_574969 [Hypoxylon sp. FL1284]|nr:hypothetical protein GGR52DRAFT_574969 [Hypoxylon sp. FL1284]